MDFFLVMDHGFLPTSHLEFPQEKVLLQVYNTHKFPIFFLGLDFVSRYIYIYAWLLNLLLGFLCWGVCEPSVVGMSFDFVVLNLTKHSSYLIYNASLFFSSTIQKQYYEKYGHGEVRAFFL
jgi:hypothetical protein